MANETRKHLYVDLPPGWHDRLRVIAAKERLKLKDIVAHALKPIIKSGKSGLNGSAK